MAKVLFFSDAATGGHACDENDSDVTADDDGDDDNNDDDCDKDDDGHDDDHVHDGPDCGDDNNGDNIMVIIFPGFEMFCNSNRDPTS